MKLIARARASYINAPLPNDLDLDLDATVYALDATTNDLCLSVFSWAHFRSTNAAVTLHTLLDLRGAIPSFIHITDGKTGDVSALDLLCIEAGTWITRDSTHCIERVRSSLRAPSAI